MEAQSPSRSTSYGCLWFGLMLIAMVVGLLAFGFNRVGRACMILAFAIPLAQSLKTGDFGFNIYGRQIRRDINPRWFWGTALAFAASATFSLFLFIDEVRNPGG